MIIYLTSDFEPREKNIFFLLGCLGEILIPLETMFFGDKKLGILFSGRSEILPESFPGHVPRWIRNSESSPVFFGGSETLNTFLCLCGRSEIQHHFVCGGSEILNPFVRHC